MKKSLHEKVMRRLLREAEEDLDLGNVEFSPARSDGVSNREQNTPFEDLLYSQLDAWIRGEDGHKLKGPGGADDILRLMKHPKYSRFFKEAEAGTEVYRGVAMTREQLGRMIDRDPADLPPEGEVEGKFPAALARRSGAASWTYDESRASTFAEVRVESTASFSVVWTAEVDDNPGVFLDLWRVVLRTSKNPVWNVFSAEAEVLALRPVTACRVRWW